MIDSAVRVIGCFEEVVDIIIVRNVALYEFEVRMIFAESFRCLSIDVSKHHFGTVFRQNVDRSSPDSCSST